MARAAVLLLVLLGAAVDAQTPIYQRTVPPDFQLRCNDGYELLADHGDVETWVEGGTITYGDQPAVAGRTAVAAVTNVDPLAMAAVPTVGMYQSLDWARVVTNYISSTKPVAGATGQLPARKTTATCRPCSQGTATMDGLRCLPCPIGFIAENTTMNECKICPVGSISVTVGLTRRSAFLGALEQSLQNRAGAATPINMVAPYDIHIGCASAWAVATTTPWGRSGPADCGTNNAAGASLLDMATQDRSAHHTNQTGLLPTPDLRTVSTTNMVELAARGVPGAVAPGIQWEPQADMDNDNTTANAASGLAFFSGVAGGTFCAPCPNGWYQPAAGGHMCLPCPPGTWSERNTSATPVAGASECTPCLEGKFSASIGRGRTCSDCPLNTFSKYKGSTMCTPCPLGSVAAVGASNCTKCPMGWYRSDPLALDCSPCPKGHYTDDEGSTICKPAPLGTYVANTNQSYYELCPAGRYTPNWGSHACIDCPPGTYTDVAGMPTCIPCPPGHFSEIGKSACSACPTGSHLPWPSNVFKYTDENEIPDGTTASGDNLPDLFANWNAYMAKWTAANAVAWPNVAVDAGNRNYTANAGWNATLRFAVTQSACIQCPKGYYQSKTGQPTCIPCPPGQYNDLIGATECKKCPVGRSSYIHASKCDNCPKGTYASSEGSPRCVPCSKGFYQPLPGMGTCDRAPLGGYVPTAGSIGYFVCPRGYHAAEQASGRCMACNEGQYADVPLAGDKYFTQLATLVPSQRLADFSAATHGWWNLMEPVRMIEDWNAGTAPYVVVDTAIARTGVDGASLNATGLEGKIFPRPDLVDTWLATCTNAAEPGLPADAFKTTFGIPGSANRTSATCTLATWQSDVLDAAVNGRKYGATACRSCPAGHFAFNSSATLADCIPCAPGFFARYKGTHPRIYNASFPAGTMAEALSTVTTYTSSITLFSLPVPTVADPFYNCDVCPAGEYSCGLGQNRCRKLPCDTVNVYAVDKTNHTLAPLAFSPPPTSPPPSPSPPFPHTSPRPPPPPPLLGRRRRNDL